MAISAGNGVLSLPSSPPGRASSPAKHWYYRTLPFLVTHPLSLGCLGLLSLTPTYHLCSQTFLISAVFVLQGGEDAVQNDEWLTDVVSEIRAAHPDKAITLSVGERSAEAYRAFRKAGANRYLLRHETRNDEHYSLLHPSAMSAENRRQCLTTLKKEGYQTGSGMMIGSPGQTVEHIIDDLQFLEELQPEMIGIGPFIPAAGTPFANEPAGSIETTLLLISLLRLRFPSALIPATTALATLHPKGRTQAILAGANVVMPNLSPRSVRSKYSIYNDKATSAIHKSSPPFSMDVGSVLHGVLPPLQPAHG